MRQLNQVSIRVTEPMAEALEAIQDVLESVEMRRPSATSVATKALVRGLRVLQRELKNGKKVQ